MTYFRCNIDRGRGRGQGRLFGGGRPTGPLRRHPLRVNARPSAYTIAKSFHRPKNSLWQHDLFEESLTSAGLPGFDNGAKLYVSNLDTRVTNDDIRELFSMIGELKRYAIHYDKNGCPTGSAEVLFARRTDAFQAHQRYHNVQLDGKPMKIGIDRSNLELPVSARVNVVGGRNRQRTVVMTLRNRGGMMNVRGGMTNVRGGMTNVRRGGMTNVRRGGMTNARGGGMTNAHGGMANARRGGMTNAHGGMTNARGRGKEPAVGKYADELDKELENYHAMQS